MKKTLRLFVTVWLLSLSIFSQTKRSISPEAQAHYEKARQYETNNDNPLAESEYRKSLAANKGYYPKAWWDFCWYLSQRLHFSEAAQALENYHKQIPKNEIHQDDIKTLAQLQEVVRLEKLTQTQERPLLKTLIDYCKLVFLFARNRDNTVVRIAERTVALYPDSAEALITLATYYKYANLSRSEGISLLEKAISIEPKNAEAYYRLGDYLFFSRPELAEVQFRKALNLSGKTHAESWQSIARICMRQGRRQEAITVFRNYLRWGKNLGQYRKQIENEINQLETK